MANPEHLEWLKEGVDAWNARRERRDFTPDLKEADLREADLQGANLLGAGLRDADLRDADLQEADLLGANLRGANLRLANLRGANLLGADVTSLVYSGSGTNDLSDPEYTDLSTTLNLAQNQLDQMIGDSGTILPEGLIRPAHWHDWQDQLKDGATEPTDASPPDHPAAEPQPKYTLTVKKRNIEDIRQALTESYNSPADMAQYLVTQLQNEIAAHAVSAKPNEDEALNAWTEKSNQLAEMLIAVQELHKAIPPQMPEPEITDERAKSVKKALITLSQQLDRLIKSMDADTGTCGNLWKIGVIGVATNLLVLCGIGTAMAAPIAAGVIGVNTIKLMIGRAK